MASKILVVFVKHTGHVLAAMTRTADAESNTNLEQVVEPSLRVRLLSPDEAIGAATDLVFDIATDQLDTLLADDQADLLATPRKFKLKDPKNPSSPLDKLPAVTHPPPTSIVGSRIKEDPVLSANEIKVEMEYESGPPTDKPTPVWVLIKRDADNFQIVSGEIAANVTFKNLPLLVPNLGGQREVLVLAGSSAVYAKKLP